MSRRHLVVVSGEGRPSSRHAERTDDELMLLARGGAQAAFETLIRRHQSRALLVAYRHVGTTAGAEDVVQDSFVQLYRALPTYRPQGRFSAFLFRIVIRRAQMHRRRLRRRWRSEPPGDDRDPRIPPVAEDLILASERRRDLQRAVNALPERQRLVLALRFGGELRHEEIADVLGIPEGTAFEVVGLFLGVALRPEEVKALFESGHVGHAPAVAVRQHFEVVEP